MVAFIVHSSTLNLRRLAHCPGGQGPCERAHSIKALACRDIKHLLSAPANAAWGLAPRPDDPKYTDLAANTLNACDRGEVDRYRRIDRMPSAPLFGARGNVAKLGERALFLTEPSGCTS